MRRILITLLLCCAPALFAADATAGKIIKVLPFMMDAEGRIAKTPSLFDRDAYQSQLRKHPNQVSGLRYDVQCSAEKTLKLRLELRGVGEKSAPKIKILEADVAAGSGFNNWTEIKLTGEEFQKFGAVTAWRATLWDGDKQLGYQQSFLW
jgi:hypothetical protein